MRGRERQRDQRRHPVPIPWSHRLTDRHWVLVDCAFALLLGASSIIAIFADSHAEKLRLHGAGWDAIRIVAVVVACAALALRRRRPSAALAVATIATRERLLAEGHLSRDAA